MIQLLRHIGLSLAFFSNDHSWLERRDLDRVQFFQSPDSVHFSHRCTHCLHHHVLYLQLVPAWRPKQTDRSWRSNLGRSCCQGGRVESLSIQTHALRCSKGVLMQFERDFVSSFVSTNPRVLPRWFDRCSVVFSDTHDTLLRPSNW